MRQSSSLTVSDMGGGTEHRGNAYSFQLATLKIKRKVSVPNSNFLSLCITNARKKTNSCKVHAFRNTLSESITFKQ